MGLQNDTMCSTENYDCKGFVCLVYFDHRRKTRVITFTKYLMISESEYRTLYRDQKWLAAKSDSESGFYVGGQYTEDEEEAGYNVDN